MATSGILSTKQIQKHNAEQFKKTSWGTYKKNHHQHVTHTNARIQLVSSSNVGGKAKSWQPSRRPKGVGLSMGRLFHKADTMRDTILPSTSQMTLFHQGNPEHISSIRLLEQAETKGIGCQAITTHLEDATLRMSRLCLFNSRSSFHLFGCLTTAAVTDQVLAIYPYCTAAAHCI